MRLTSNFVLTEVGDSVMAVPVGEQGSDSRFLVRLNETAADIWHGIEQQKSLEEIAADLVEKYDGVDNASALEHVKNTVNTLIEQGIVET